MDGCIVAWVDVSTSSGGSDLGLGFSGGERIDLNHAMAVEREIDTKMDINMRERNTHTHTHRERERERERESVCVCVCAAR